MFRHWRVPYRRFYCTTVDNGVWCVVARMISINDFAVVQWLLEHIETIQHMHTH